jgi:hypothetical protein
MTGVSLMPCLHGQCNSAGKLASRSTITVNALAQPRHVEVARRSRWSFLHRADRVDRTGGPTRRTGRGGSAGRGRWLGPASHKGCAPPRGPCWSPPSPMPPRSRHASSCRSATRRRGTSTTWIGLRGSEPPTPPGRRCRLRPPAREPRTRSASAVAWCSPRAPETTAWRRRRGLPRPASPPSRSPGPGCRCFAVT